MCADIEINSQSFVGVVVVVYSPRVFLCVNAPVLAESENRPEIAGKG